MRIMRELGELVGLIKTKRRRRRRKSTTKRTSTRRKRNSRGRFV